MNIKNEAPKVEGIKEKFECEYAYRDIAKALKFDEEGFAYVELWRWSKTEHRPVKANVRIFIRYRDEELDDHLIHFSIGDKSFEDKHNCSFCYTDQLDSGMIFRAFISEEQCIEMHRRYGD